MKRRFHKDGTVQRGSIFVFGSNLAGIHGAGAALEAKKTFGAVLGVGEGITGRAYAIPTKDAKLRVRPISEIRRSVGKFVAFASTHEALFQVTRVGCGLAGYKDEQMAVLFVDAPFNCSLPDAWRQYVGGTKD
jgi:hypothetical protein